MSIAPYLKHIGRGLQGARALSRADAAELFAQILDGSAGELEIGAFCMAMRIKGETPDEFAGFLDAIAPRLQLLPESPRPVVVIPSYNGARKRPLLTPLLAMLLAREQLSVLVHGPTSAPGRVSSASVLALMDIMPRTQLLALQEGEVAYVPTELLCPALQRLLAVRDAIGVRNCAHSLVKMLTPCASRALVLASHTHSEYAVSMAAALTLTHANAILMRGTEGEPVADPRRMPGMTGFLRGHPVLLQEAQTGGLGTVPDLPVHIDAAHTARYTAAVLAGESAVPETVACQVRHIVGMAARL